MIIFLLIKKKTFFFPLTIKHMSMLGISVISDSAAPRFLIGPLVPHFTSDTFFIVSAHSVWLEAVYQLYTQLPSRVWGGGAYIGYLFFNHALASCKACKKIWFLIKVLDQPITW